jgi:predicted DNA-binding protein
MNAKSDLVIFRVSPATKRRWRVLAAQRGQSLSTYLRELVRRAESRPGSQAAPEAKSARL